MKPCEMKTECNKWGQHTLSRTAGIPAPPLADSVTEVQCHSQHGAVAGKCAYRLTLADAFIDS